MIDKDFLFDKRLQERFLRRNKLTVDKLKAYLEGLPDVTHNAEVITRHMTSSDSQKKRKISEEDRGD